MRGSTAILFFTLLVLPSTVSAQAPALVAATWNDQSVHVLDASLNDISSFPVMNTNPNGVTSDGSTIWVAQFSSMTVDAYDATGGFLFSWPKLTSSCQGITLVAGTNEVAVAESTSINFYEPVSGTFVRSIPNPSGTNEGLAADGDTLWCIIDFDLIQLDVFTGAVLATIPNAASGEAFGGTGIANADASSLYVAGTSGSWWLVEKATGNVIGSGNNSLEMFGLGSLETAVAPDIMLRGDCNGDLSFSGLTDGLFALNYQFVMGSPEPPCLAQCDADGDGGFSGLLDGIYILNFQFVPGSPPIPPPYPDCGQEAPPYDSIGQLGCDTPVCP